MQITNCVCKLRKKDANGNWFTGKTQLAGTRPTPAFDSWLPPKLRLKLLRRGVYLYSGQTFRNPQIRLHFYISQDLSSETNMLLGENVDMMAILQL